MSGYADSISILDDYFPHLNSNSRHFLNISGSDIFTSNNSHHASSLNTSSSTVPLNSATATPSASNNAPNSSAPVSSSASSSSSSSAPTQAQSTSSPTTPAVPTMSNPTPSTAASSSSQQSINKGESSQQQQQQPQSIQAQPQQTPRAASPVKMMQLPLDNGNSSGDENESRGTKRSGSFDDGDKKKRIKWAGELHERFLKAIEKLGDRAVPSAILNEMKVEGLTRENVASHLQKYRVQTREKLLNEYIKHAPPILYPPPLPGRVGHGLPYPHDMDYDLYHRRRSESELYYPQHYSHHRASMPALPAYGAHYYGAHPPAGHYPTITEAAASYHSGGNHHYSTTPLAHYPRSASFSHSVECAYPDSVEGEHPSPYPQSSWRSGGAFTPISNPALARRSSFSHATPSAGAPSSGAPVSRSSHPESDHLDEGAASSFHPQSSSAASSGKELFPDFPILSAGPSAGSRGGHAAPMADYGNGQAHPGNCSSGFCCGNTSEAPAM